MNKEKPREKKRAPLTRRRWFQWSLGAVLAAPLAAVVYSFATFPSDRTPAGAYLRIVKSVNQGRPEDFFAYTEEAAQHACFTIADYRKQLIEVASHDFPKKKFAELQNDYGEFAEAQGGAEVFALMVHREGWLAQMRQDMSGIKAVEEQGPRATITTSKGTRYSLRKRPGGIWGLTAFTPTLVSEAERAARDLEQVQRAAADFARAKQNGAPVESGTAVKNGTAK